MFSEKKYFLLVYCSLLTSPPVFVCAKQAAVQPCILPVNYFLTHKQCSCETFNYLCWWHLSWPTPTRFLPSPPCLSGNFLHFPSIICMCVVFELKGKRKKGEMYMCLNSCFAMVRSWFTHMYGQKLARLSPPCMEVMTQRVDVRTVLFLILSHLPYSFAFPPFACDFNGCPPSPPPPCWLSVPFPLY